MTYPLNKLFFLFYMVVQAMPHDIIFIAVYAHIKKPNVDKMYPFVDKNLEQKTQQLNSSDSKINECFDKQLTSTNCKLLLFTHSRKLRRPKRRPNRNSEFCS